MELARRYHFTCEIFHFNYISFFLTLVLSERTFFDTRWTRSEAHHTCETFHLDDEVWRMCGNSWISIFLSLFRARWYLSPSSSSCCLAFIGNIWQTLISLELHLCALVEKSYFASIAVSGADDVLVLFEQFFRFDNSCVRWRFSYVLRLRENRKSTEAQSERRNVFPDSHNLGFGK